MEAASQVISALQDARGKDSKGKGGKGATRKQIIKEEVASLFNKQPKLVAWKHRFVCLGDRKQLRILTTDAEKDQLCRAGLGERNVQFDDMELEAEEIREVLFVTFPKLRDTGGFVLCKCLVNSRNLVPLSQFAWSSLKTLKEKVGSARTYICPLQKDLDLSPEVEEPVGAGLLEKCLTCEEVDIDELPAHLEVCAAVEENSVEIDSTSPTCTVSDDDLPLPPTRMKLSDDKMDDDEVNRIEDKMISTAIMRSLTGSTSSSVQKSPRPKEEITLGQLQGRICNPPVVLNIRRGDVLNDALSEAKKQKFYNDKHIKVVFVGEGAVDQGVPRREFFRLLAKEFGSRCMVGKEDYKFWLADVGALQNRDYYYMGVYTVMSILQGGCGVPIMAKPVFDYLSGIGECTGIDINESEIPDGLLKIIVRKQTKL
ncbi:uncharacterized protein [Dysidea avara]|uniref:uncharacterized protein isoform X3 n=1 Tax=Dysidea avara TaxID=196820 RepID=UPI00333462E8